MTTKTLIIVAALTVAVAAPALAAEKEGRKKGAAGAPGRPGGQFGGNLDELNLTAEQKTKLEAFQQEQREKMQGLRDAPPEERREKFQKLQEGTTAKMKEVLTKEQFEKWEKSRAAGPGAGLAGGRERMQKAMEELNLNDEQKEKVRAAMQEQGEKMQALGNATPEERREKGQKMQETFNAKMKEILTKEQFEKWEKARPNLAGQPGGGDNPRRKREEKK